MHLRQLQVRSLHSYKYASKVATKYLATNLLSYNLCTLTWSDIPGPIGQYDKRAADIWEAIDNAEVDSEGAKLCWAADRLLLDIIIDELGCEKELFYSRIY